MTTLSIIKADTGAGQDLLSDAFSGNLHGMGPGYAELEYTERPSEPVICFLADKTEPGAWNLPLYKIFADPFNTAGLVIDPKMHGGFSFEVHDLHREKMTVFDCPEQLYDLLMYIGAPARYVVHSVRSRTLEVTCAATSTQRLSLIAGKYVGKDDPVMILRCQSGLPAVGEVLGPRDMFGGPSFDHARQQANVVMDYLRRHGPFEAHRLPPADLEYTTMHALEEHLVPQWTSMARAAVPTPR